MYSFENQDNKRMNRDREIMPESGILTREELNEKIAHLCHISFFKKQINRLDPF